MTHQTLITMKLNEGSILIVCEGTKTENYFLDDLFKLLTDRGCCAIDYPKIVPPPEREADTETIASGRKRGGRAMNPEAHETKPEPVLPGPPPLNWVNTAIEGLKSHSEAWVIFDHDDHPARKEAFDTVRNARNQGQNINIVFSSRSFEYYMLQHFHYLYHQFSQTECHAERHKYLHCCHPTKQPLERACDGELNTPGNCCINGYARKRGYWTESKNENVMSVLPSLWRGVCNAYHIKWDSIRQDCVTPIYERNPYLNTYRIVLRFMGIKSLEFGCPIEIKGVALIYLGNAIRIINNSGNTLILSERNMPIYRPAPVAEISDDARLRLDLIGNLQRTVIDNSVEKVVSLDSISEEEFALISVLNTTIFVTKITPTEALLQQDVKQVDNWSNI